jgi:hypothetical protein
MLYDFYFLVNNLLDRKNCVQVFPTTGSCSGGLYDVSRLRLGVEGAGANSTALDRPHYVGTRRSMIAGIRISF